MIKRQCTVICKNGHQWTTSINGTDAEIQEYFKVGSKVNAGNVEDNIQQIVSCQIHLNLKYLQRKLCLDYYTITGRENVLIVYDKMKDKYYWWFSVLGHKNEVDFTKYTVTITEKKED